MPVTLVLVLAGHSSTRSGGQLIVGGIVSRTVMVWTQLLLLPHWSVAVQVRAMSLVAPHLVLGRALWRERVEISVVCVLVKQLQLEVGVGGHSNNRVAGSGRHGA